MASYESRIWTNWALKDKYDMIKQLGQGSYGEVAEARNKTSGARVAVKKMIDLFLYDTDVVRTYREMNILKNLSHPCIVKLIDVVFKPASPKGLSVGPGPTYDSITRKEGDLYFVFELMQTDLRKVIYESNTFLNTHQIKSIMYQMLRGLKYIHSGNILHRDLKPENILLTMEESSNTYIAKLADFGLARVVEGRDVIESSHALNDSSAIESTGNIGPPLDSAWDGSDDDDLPARPSIMKRQYSVEVVTPWYRCPELWLKQSSYTNGVDIWSAGCILAELLGSQDGSRKRKPLFKFNSRVRNNKDVENLLGIYFDLIGTPLEEDIEALDITDPETLKMLRDMKPIPQVGADKRQYVIDTMQRRYPNAEQDAISLLVDMLQFNPSNRITIDNALAAPFFADIRLQSQEIVMTPDQVMSFDVEAINEEGSNLLKNIADKILSYDEESIDEGTCKGGSKEDTNQPMNEKSIDASFDIGKSKSECTNNSIYKYFVLPNFFVLVPIFIVVLPNFYFYYLKFSSKEVINPNSIGKGWG